MDPAEAQRLMSPSVWVRRTTADAVILEHLNVTSTASKKARAAIPHQLDIRYGPRPKQLIDEFGNDLPGYAPIAVYVHGGYWQELDKTDSAYIVEPLHAVGCRVFVVGYDLCPDVTLDDIVEEICEAAKYIVRFAVDRGSSRLWFLGHSAGGHLVVTLALNGILSAAISETKILHKPPVIGIVSLAGVFDLTPLIYTDINDALRLTTEHAAKLSPLLHSSPPPGVADKRTEIAFYIVAAEHDSPELQKQSKRLWEKLISWGSTANFLSVSNVDHFSLVENLRQDDCELTKIVVGLVSGKK